MTDAKPDTSVAGKTGHPVDLITQLADALAQAQVRRDHGDAPYDPDLLTLFRAAEKVIAVFRGEQPAPAFPEGVVIKWVTDDIAEIHIGDPDRPGRGNAYTITYDELGTAGMQGVVHIVNLLGLLYGFPVDVEGEPGV